MPFVSKAQAAYFNTHKAQLAKQGVSVNEWNAASKGVKLPEHVKQHAQKHLGKRTFNSLKVGIEGMS